MAGFPAMLPLLLCLWLLPGLVTFGRMIDLHARAESQPSRRRRRPLYRWSPGTSTSISQLIQGMASKKMARHAGTPVRT